MVLSQDRSDSIRRGVKDSLLKDETGDNWELIKSDINIMHRARSENGFKLLLNTFRNK